MARHIPGPLYFEQIGASGRPMFFIHSTPDDHRLWMFQTAHFSAWYRTVAVDLAGYGRSPASQQGVSVADQAAACWEVLDRIPSQEVIIQGNSLGAFVALHMAQQRPMRTCALILSGCGYLKTREMMVRWKKRYQEDGIALREVPVIEAVPKSAGLMFAARRNADADSYFWRVGQWMMPFFTTIPAFPGLGPLAGHAWVPADDGCSTVFTFSWHSTRPLTREELAVMNSGTAVHAGLIPGTFMPMCNRSNEYAGPDAPPAQQPWMRIKRFQDQDICITESIGADFDRTEENLGSSDAVIGRVRATLASAARGLREGREPPGRNPAEYRMRPVSVQLPRNTPSWAEEIAAAVDTRPETFRASV